MTTSVFGMIPFVLVDCGNLDHPVNGRVEYFNSNYQSLASYTCDKGYKISGNNVRQCGADALWDLTTPICEIRGLAF